jgi:nucleoside-diphosphate-sugar epimerase
MSDLYLITGGAGFIGSNISEKLVLSGEKVRVIDNFLTGKPENMTTFRDNIEFIEGDIRDLDTVNSAMKDVDYVIHQAALPSVPKSVELPIESNEHNTNGTLNILYAAKEAGVKRVVYAASSSAYGDQPQSPKVETMLPMPMSPYAVNKLAGEHYCAAFSSVYGLETVALRYFNVFGPRQDPTSFYSAVIPKFITALLEDEQPTIYGDGEQSRDFTHIDNVVHANLLACKAPNIGGEMFNIACGESITLNELLESLKKILQKDIQPVYEDERIGDVKHSLADITKAKKKLNFEVKVNTDQGLKLTVDWFQKNPIK